MSLDFSLWQVQPTEVFTANITHNLNKMAKEVGVYKCLWRPEESGFTYARELIPILQQGLVLMHQNRADLLQYEPANGWGRFENLVSFIARVLDKCMEYPDAKIGADI